MAAKDASLSLRFPAVWWTVGWLLVAGVCIGSLLPGTALPNLFIGDKWQHAGAYFLLMIWFGGLSERGRHFVVAAILLVLGFGLDSIQGGMVSRRFDLADVAANGVGIILGLILTRSVLAGWCHRVERLLLA